MKLTNAETALLGLLSEEAMHPYKIEQEVKFRDMRYWTELSMSSIYKLLRKLEKAELVNRENKISKENRLQKLYSISDEGRKALKEKLKKLLQIPEETRWQVDIGLYNCSLLTKTDLITSLNTYRQGLKERVKGYYDLNKFLKDENCPNHRLELANRPVFLLKAEIEWVDSYLKTLSE